MARKKVQSAPPNPVSLRLPQKLLDRAEKLVKTLERHEDFINVRVSKNYVLKMAVLRGLEVMEQDPLAAK